ncbi:hypothetical protein DFH11DRAFT_1601561 [Phellopilus nigrolimitatus]|nr:hypothetical protein DFH11DRAFT_1601561 [Phellopilus nigrolimitatus]
MLQAGRRSLAIRDFIHGRHNPPTHSKRTFSRTSCSLNTFSLPSSYIHSGNIEVKEDYASKTRRQKLDDLSDNLSRDRSNPNRTWAHYVDLLDFARDDPIPLDLHQRVLRRCTPDVSELRAAYVKGLRDSGISDSPHIHEARFLTVIRNIRRAGWSPALDDYNFILAHFAAVGHYVGAVQVLQEIDDVGLQARTKTYGLCLQAIAYRLTLPCRVKDKDNLHSQCARLCLHIIDNIRRRNQAVPSVCLDLALRIMKDTGKTGTFMTLLKVAYGVNLEYPDRHFLDTETVLKKVEPFSTAALTNVVDFFGRQGQVSKMVVAFEVLSTALKTGLPGPRSPSFDDDDDDDFVFPSETVSPLQPLPSARANITTYNTVIRHSAQSTHTVFAKHYVLQAIELDSLASSQLREEVRLKSLFEVTLPDLQVNVDTFRPILGLANRNGDIALTKWLMGYVRMVFRRKREDLLFFSDVLARSEAPVQSDGMPHTTSVTESESVPTVVHSRATLASSSNSSEMSSESVLMTRSPSFLSTTSSHSPLSSSPSTSLDGEAEAEQTNPLDIDLEPPLIPISPKVFDLSLHVRLLQRDIDSMRTLNNRIGTALQRLSARKKEDLGRRVWKDLDIYMRDVDRRVKVGRERWKEIVNFGGSMAQSQPQVRQDELPAGEAKTVLST